MPIQPEGLPSDHREIDLGLPVNLYTMKLLAGQMAGATSTPIKMMMPLPLRFQVVMTSEPTLFQSTPSGSPPLLFSSAHLPRWHILNRRRCRSDSIFVRCDWVDRNRGALVAPPAADDPTGAQPHLEGV